MSAVWWRASSAKSLIVITQCQTRTAIYQLNLSTNVQVTLVHRTGIAICPRSKGNAIHADANESNWPHSRSPVMGGLTYFEGF